MRRLLLALLLIPALSYGATYTVTVGSTVNDTDGTVTVPMPAGSLDGKLILIVSSHNDFNGRTLSTAPTGYTEMTSAQPGTSKSMYMWGKIGTASESSQAVEWASGTLSAWAIAVESSTGWDAIGSVLDGADTGSAASPTGEIQYGARTTTADGNFIVQFGKRFQSPAGTGVAVTSGWTSAGDDHITGLAAAMQWRSVSGNAAANSVAITGGSGTNSSTYITAEFTPAAGGPTVTLSDATPDIDTTVTATLSGAFGAGGNPTLVTFASGDTVACSSATSTTCDFPLNYSALVASGDLGTTQAATATTLTVTNGTETSQSTAVNIQIPASGYAIVDLTCTAGTDCSDDSEAIVPMIAGDDCAIKVNTGSLNQLSTECAPVFNGGAFSYTVARYDESATAWLAQEEVSVTPPTSCRGIVGDIVFDIVQDILKEMQCVD